MDLTDEDTSDTAFATSAFGEHTVLGTISVITGIMAGVAKPFLAKLADLFSRPWALALSVLFYTIGYIVVAASKNVADVAGGEVIYTIGNTGLDFITSILLVSLFPTLIISYPANLWLGRHHLLAMARFGHWSLFLAFYPLRLRCK